MKKGVLLGLLFLWTMLPGVHQLLADVWYVGTWTGKADSQIKATIQEAINGAKSGDEVWVAKGIYSLSATLDLKDGVSLFGGFAGSEAKLSDRTLKAGGKTWDFVNETVLDAQEKGRVLTGKKFTKQVVIDGFTVKNGKASATLKTGGGLYAEDYTMVRNCILTNNYAPDAGGAVNIRGVSSSVENCFLTNNKGKHGGGVAIGSGGEMTGCLVTGNATHSTTSTSWSEGWGGGIFSDNGTVYNCEIYANKASFGGGIYLRNSGAAFYNCIIAHNIGHQGGGVSSDYRCAGGKVVNSVIAFNTSTKGGGILFTADNQNVVNSVVWGNIVGDELVHFEIYNPNKPSDSDKKPIIQNCAFQGDQEVLGTDNILLAKDSAAYFGAGWLPVSNFPGIDKGISVAGMPTVDIAGNLRITGRGVDIGPYEKVIIPKPTNDIFYVKADAVGTMDGSSWENAFLDLGAAISSAKVYNTENGKKTKIWVAAGTYAINGTVTLQEGVSVYGGFKGTETSEANREMGESGKTWDFKNPTILDAGKECGVFSQAANYTKFDAVVDGFTIQNGKAVNGGGAGMLDFGILQNCKFLNCEATTGGGVYYGSNGSAYNTSVKITACYFSECSAKDGGALNVAPYMAKGEVANCFAENNQASASGGGFYVQGNLMVTNCVIKNNKSLGNSTATGGGGLFARVQINVRGCLITGNEAVRGGGIFTIYNNSSSKDINILNNTIAGNISTESAGGYMSAATSTKKPVNLMNNVFWKNAGKTGEGQITFAADMDHKLSNNAIEGQTDFTSAGKIIYTDNITLDGADSVRIFGKDYALVKNSPCIDKGNNSTPIGLPTEDIAGNLRTVKGVVDMGAYEYNASAGLKPDANHIFYVKENGSGDGSSWNRAAGDMDAVFGAAYTYKNSNSNVSPQIWIAGGTYLLDFSVKLYAGINVYGSFKGDETSIAARPRAEGAKPWEFTYATVVDGQKKCRLFEQDAAFSDDKTVFDGLTIQNGKVEGNGGGFCSSNTDGLQPGTVQNCKFLNCESTESGGAVFMRTKGTLKNSYIEGCSAKFGGAFASAVYNATPVVESCTFVSNKATNRGGAIYGRLSTKVMSCWFEKNACDGNEESYGGGGAINFQSGGTILNSVFVSNTAKNGGAVMGAYESTSIGADLNIVNSTMANNTAVLSGGAVYRFSAHTQTSHHKMMTVSNTVFWGNKTGKKIEHVQTFLPETDELAHCALNGESGTLVGIRTNNQVLTDSVSNFGVNWALQEKSVCVDNGKSVSGLPETDCFGQPRLNGLAYDIGAYEYQSKYDFHPSAEGIFYVKAAETPDQEQGSGASWDDPIREVIFAAQAAKSYKEKNPGKSVQIWIAAGTYPILSVMPLGDGVNIYGGFAGTESNIAERTKVTGGKPWEFEHETILDGKGGSQIFSQDKDFAATTYVEGLTFQNGKTSSSVAGGAMYLKANMVVQYCKFLNCESGKNGGAINLAGSGKVSKVLYCYIYKNAANNGGGIFTDGDKVEIENCWVEGNTAKQRAGGIYVYQATVRNSYILNNHSDGNEAILGGGGGLYGRDGGKFYNCIVVGNTANRGAGIMAGLNSGYSFSITVVNCVVVNNAATENGGGLYASPCKSAYGVKCYNTILWDNTLNNRINHKMELVQLFNCAVQNGDGVIADVDKDCITVAESDKAAAFDENWIPVSGSPCIDAGTSEGIDLSPTDYLGNKRVSNQKVDVGAYEYQNPADNYKIDYINETLSYIPDPNQTVECSASKDDWNTVSFSSLIQKDSVNIYCRLASAQQNIIVLEIPGRGLPTAAVDFDKESLKSVTAGSEWDIAATGVFVAIVDLELGVYIDNGGKQNVTVKQPATATTFKTEKVLDIPARLEAPAGLTLNYVEEVLEGMTDLSVLEGKTADKFSPISGASISKFIPSGADVDLVVRLKATDKDFVSKEITYTLSARPATPVYTINFNTAQTNEVVPSTVIVDTTDTFETAFAGQNALLDLTLGWNYCFKVSASQENATFASKVSYLEVPERPDMESLALNYQEEKIVGLPNGAVWNYEDVSGETAIESISGMIPEEGARTLSIYVNVSDTTFASEPYNLVIPARPAAPADVTVDYRKESISSSLSNLEIKKGGDEYENFRNQSLDEYIPANGTYTLTVRAKAKNTDIDDGEGYFASEETLFTLTPRPAVPAVFSIDFLNETTVEAVVETLEYTTDTLGNNWMVGENATGTLAAGEIHYFRVAASDENRTFASRYCVLDVPVRPEIALYDVEKMIGDKPFTPEMWNSWTNTTDEIILESTNSSVAAVDGQVVTIKGIGECQLVAKMPAVEGEHFAAEEKTVTLKVVSSNGSEGDDLKIQNLMIAGGHSDMTFRIPELENIPQKKLVFFNRSGKVIFESKSYGNDFNMGDLDAGTYYYVLTYQKDGKDTVKKGFVEIVR